MNVNAIEPVRTAPPAYQGGRIYECDPAAVERLRALMAEQRQQREADDAARLARQETAARLLAAAKRRKTQQPPVSAVAATATKPTHSATGSRKRRCDAINFTGDQLAAAVAAHNDDRRTWGELAAGMGVSRHALRDALAAAGYDVAQMPRVRKGTQPRFTDGQIRAVHARQAAGERLKDIAAEHGVPWQSFNRRFRQLELPSVRFAKEPLFRARANGNGARSDEP